MPAADLSRILFRRLVRIFSAYPDAQTSFAGFQTENLQKNRRTSILHFFVPRGRGNIKVYTCPSLEYILVYKKCKIPFSRNSCGVIISLSMFFVNFIFAFLRILPQSFRIILQQIRPIYSLCFLTPKKYSLWSHSFPFDPTQAAKCASLADTHPTSHIYSFIFRENLFQFNINIPFQIIHPH